MICGWKSTSVERPEHLATGRVTNMPAWFLHPGFARRLPVDWCESQWTLPIAERHSRERGNHYQGHQPTFIVLPVCGAQPVAPGSSREITSSEPPGSFPAFKPKPPPDKRIDPS